MEAEVGPVALMPPQPIRAVGRDCRHCAAGKSISTARPIAANANWLISPATDLVFVANLWWLAAFAVLIVPTGLFPNLEFWQVYFLTTPHRWLTILLVLMDPDRRRNRGARMVGYAAVLLVGVVFIR